MRFENGKVYIHASGKIVKIVGLAQTTGGGLCCVAEDTNGSLTPFGIDSDDYTINWTQAPEVCWLKAWCIDQDGRQYV